MIFFNPYDILPYAAGVVKIEFSYEDLSEFLKSEFIPVALNSDAQAPAPILRFPANTDMEAYQTVEYVDAATTDSDVTFAMYGSNTVYNLSLSLVDWVEGQPFLRQSVYTANYLSDANLVIVQADVTTDRGRCAGYDPICGVHYEWRHQRRLCRGDGAPCSRGLPTYPPGAGPAR